ncbi:YrdB family protein [Streptomyces sp. E11-3]|uniref:YrdB family protein n=1 Tax=Streptomyces sp. E11-3 TaxID=3110112 RepID=UPI003980ACAF
MRLGYHPAMLGLRFLLELTALACFGYWAWWVSSGGLRYVAVVGVPVLVAVAWGVFATPGDESRSGGTVVATAGALRLLLELAVFFGGAAALYTTGRVVLALVLTGVLVAYHAAALDRLGWLIRH